MKLLLGICLTFVSTFVRADNIKNTRVLISNSAINCDSNLVEKKGECEFVLSYDLKSQDVYLIKLFSRGSEGADINSLARDPASYEKDSILVEYKDQIKLKRNEKIISVGGSFIRDLDNQKKLKMKLRVQVGKVKLIEPEDLELGPEPDRVDEIDYDQPIEVFSKKRQINLEVNI